MIESFRETLSKIEQFPPLNSRFLAKLAQKLIHPSPHSNKTFSPGIHYRTLRSTAPFNATKSAQKDGKPFGASERPRTLLQIYRGRMSVDENIGGSFRFRLVFYLSLVLWLLSPSENCDR
jgi:hypothetical protein